MLQQDKSLRTGIGHPQLRKKEARLLDCPRSLMKFSFQVVVMLGQRQWLRAASALDCGRLLPTQQVAAPKLEVLQGWNGRSTGPSRPQSPCAVEPKRLGTSRFQVDDAPQGRHELASSSSPGRRGFHMAA